MRIVPWFERTRFEGLDTRYLRDAGGILNDDARDRNKRVPLALTALGFDCAKSKPDGYDCERTVPGFVYCVSREPKKEEFDKKYPAIISVHSSSRGSLYFDRLGGDRTACAGLERP